VGSVGVPQTTTLINPQATTTIPEGCFAQTIPQVVFIGKVENVSDASVSFSIQKTISGDASAYVSGDGRVEVQYGTDGKFLDTGSVYIVGAVTDPFSPILVSKVRPETTTLVGLLVKQTLAMRAQHLKTQSLRCTKTALQLNTGVLRPLTEKQSAHCVGAACISCHCIWWADHCGHYATHEAWHCAHHATPKTV
jgi:hypothetical protein